MLATLPSAVPGRSLQGADFKARLQRLRQTDNRTNWLYLLRTYLYLAAVIGGTIAFYHYRAAAGLSFAWNVPVTFLAVILIGAGQHQLAGLGHEATHHTLFRNRYLNDLASDWLCMFPLFSTTYYYRLQHLAHHQFVNDPQRDPDVFQLTASGHRLDFPLTKGAFFRALASQVWLPKLVRYILVRGKYSSAPTGGNPYLASGAKPSPPAFGASLGYVVVLVVLLGWLIRHGDPWLLATLPWLLWLGALMFFAFLPVSAFSRCRLHPVFSVRCMTGMRVTQVTGLFWSLAWIGMTVEPRAALFYLLLWVVPLLTAFPFFMVLRQWVQHGNADCGRLTNTRVFLVNRLLDFSVFPIGQNYHLPHHLFASVPHYRLKALHELLKEYPEYRDEAVVVEGYFLPRRPPPRPPTVVEVIGPEHAPRTECEPFVDDAALEQDRVDV